MTSTFGNLVEFVSEKSKASAACLATYISTENILTNFGGITTALSLPSNGSVTKFKTGDTIFSNIRTYFKKVWLAEFNGHCSNDVLVFRTKDEKVLHPDYLHNICRWGKFTEFTVRTAKGAKMPRGDKEAIAQFELQLPSIEEQVEISKILRALDDRITLLRETNKTLESIAQGIFKSWFVDFDPVRAKMEGRQPEGMDDDTAALFPDSFEESELGLVPKGWEPSRLGSFLELAYGKALKADSRRPGGVPVYGSGGLTGWHDTPLVEVPSIIVGRKGTVGSLYWESRPFFPIDTVFFVKATRPLTHCYELLKTLSLSEMNTDAAVPGLNRENVYRLLVPNAPLEVIEAYHSTAQILRKSIDQNERRGMTLDLLRDTLLPRLISGQLRLPEAQEKVEEALS